MDERARALLGVLLIAHDASLAGEGLSLAEALRRSRYRELRPTIDEVALAEIVRANPALIGDWTLYSVDKRSSDGWYLKDDGEIGRVFEPQARRRYASMPEAVAAFVIRELDVLAAWG